MDAGLARMKCRAQVQQRGDPAVHFHTALMYKELKRLHEEDDPRGVIAEHAAKLRDILARLDAAGAVADMDMPGFKLHPLKGGRRGFWALRSAPIGG